MNVAELDNPMPDPRQIYLDWHSSSGFGKALHKLEAEYLLNHLQLTYNQTILQVGRLGGENQFIRQYFERNHVIVDTCCDTVGSTSQYIVAEPVDLPLSDDSVDVVIIPHFLEFEPQPHVILGEIDRVLKPEGQVFVFCFNPWRVDRFNRYMSIKDRLNIPNAVTPNRMMDWMSLLRFQSELVAGFHPSASQSISVPNSLLGQSKTILATAYLVKAVKRVFTMIPVRPALLKSPSLVPSRAINTPVLGNFNEADSNGVHGRCL